MKSIASYSDDSHKELKLKQVDQLNKVLNIVQQELISLRNIDVHSVTQRATTDREDRMFDCE